MKELFEDLKISRIAYLLEKIEKGNIDQKIKSFRKLEKYKITKKIGLFLLDNSVRNYNLDDELGGVSSSIIELCFKDYYNEYTEKISQIFENLNTNAQNRVLYLLTTLNDEEAFILYADLVIKYYKNREVIPIGELQNKPLAYPYLFPKLFKTLKYNIVKNNILILFNNYINYGIVPKEDLNKNKKLIIDSICKIYEEALKFKFKTTYEGLNDANYKSLRYFLEIAINLEFYVSNKKTKTYLEKLLKKNDNQLKLFIIDNYFKKSAKMDKINFNPIVRDKASRYALYELLNVYEKTDLMPKKYLNQKLLAESDLYTNFVITTNYSNEPTNIKFYKKVNYNDYDYYVFKFDYTYKYNNVSSDYLTNYICSQIGIEKYNDEEITSQFIGISGGYNKDKNISVIEKNHKKLLCNKIEKDDEDSIEKQIDELINPKLPIVNTDIKTKKTKKQKKNKNKNKKEKVKEKNNKLKLFFVKIKGIFKKKDKKLKTEKINKDKKRRFIFKRKDKSKNENLEVTKVIKEVPSISNLEDKSTIENEEANNETDEIITNKSHHIFAYIMLFLFAIFLSLLIYCMLYVYGVGSLNDGYEERTFKKVELKYKDKFTEIQGNDIFNQDQNEYFVLLYNGSKDKTDKYYVYLNEYLKRDYKFYYVDLKNEGNKFLYSHNYLNFVVYTDRLLKVKDHEYEYYVDGKNNILDEMENQIIEIKKIEKEKLKEEKKAKNNLKDNVDK